MRAWVKQQVGPSLAVLVMADDGAIDDIIETITEGKTRLKLKHMRLLSNQKKEPETYPKGFTPI